ncbi:ribonuclease HII [Candidatus Falkowbacteria bacterium HGW-Falkowbacteria-1]|jgi:ribonuclease HII|uniref:Ribonuclease HII n=1 Tax=Candidatus Falkowbacteria bacterium HGW-Falkowbacteria-1 TaxID=2013768 RepID=A0A2N2EA23_9BACT|nr:MAG: ribonuclease HII [Candidatus Falkowbacteria bacterium HGW-Falkowbacteria-1]
MDLKKEQELFSCGYKLIGAIDEVGRGPLAGPVVSACVIIDNTFKISPELEAIRDSKKLSPKKRQELFPIIKNSVKAVAIGICDNKIIDKINILQATFLSMRKALNTIDLKPDIILVDGKFPIPKIDIKQEAIISGDNIIFSIAMASIIAKVSRDFMMEEMDKKYPEYFFAKHKGYGTKLHMEMIEKFGPCPIHRFSFAPLSQPSSKSSPYLKHRPIQKD